MTVTYESIATTTLSSTSSEVEFANISGVYTDLILVTQASHDGSSAASLYLRMNSDTGANYSTTRIYGSGSSAASDRESNQTAMGAGIISNQAITSSGIFITQIMDYANSTTNKTLISRGSDDASGYVSAYVGLWRSNSAITNIKLRCGTIATPRNFRIGSTFTLYGIKAE